MKYLIILLLICGCQQENISEQNNRRQQNLKYWKDNRTNLCFAYSWAGHKGGPILTNVPCTKEVELILEKNTPRFQAW